jgi:hypothetical protein
VGPSPASFLKDDEITYRTKSRQSTIPGSGKGFKAKYSILSPITKGQGALPHYKLGDLGLVPRPKATSFPSDKMRQLSATSRLNRLQGIKTRSVGIQSSSGPQTLFYSDQLLGGGTSAAAAAIVSELAIKDRRRLGPVRVPGKTSNSLS